MRDETREFLTFFQFFLKIDIILSSQPSIYLLFWLYNVVGKRYVDCDKNVNLGHPLMKFRTGYLFHN